MKPIIKKIKFTKEEQEEIDLINKGQIVPTVKTRIDQNGIKRDIIYHRRFTFSGAITRLRQLYGGLCACGAWPLYKVMHDVGDERQGAWLVSRFCQSCYDKQYGEKK